MSVNMSVSETYSVGGVSFPTNKSIVNDAAIVQAPSLPAAESAELTVRTNDTEGSLTVAGGSTNVQTGNRIDLYWVENGVLKAARGATAGAVAGDVVPFTGLTGDVLPVATTTVTVAISVEADLGALLGDNVNGILFQCPARATFVVAGGDDVEDFSKVLDAGVAYAWFEGVGEDNPITGDTIAKVFISHADESGSQIVKSAFAYDND